MNGCGGRGRERGWMRGFPPSHGRCQGGIPQSFSVWEILERGFSNFAAFHFMADDDVRNKESVTVKTIDAYNV